MRSTFGQLLKYARSNRKEALEDFSTEALAAAIRSDFSPIFPLLYDAGLLERELVPVDAQVFTQKPAGSGRVDLALSLIGEHWSREIWLEVKIYADLHGRQIETYQGVIDQRDGALKPRLGFLLKSPFGRHPHLPRIYWRQIREIAQAAEASAVLWRDLAVYLEEARVTDPYDDPIKAAEAGAMTNAATLLRKMRRLLRRSARDARERWPELGFPTRKGVADREVETQFADHARLTIGTRGGRAYVCMGLAQRDIESGFEADEPQAVVWVEHPPNWTDVRQRLIRTAETGGLSEAWIRSWKGHWALRRQVSFASFGTLEAMRAWWFESLQELEDAGILRLIPQLGTPTAEELEAEAENTAAIDLG